MQDDRISIELRLPGVKVLEAALPLPPLEKRRRGSIAWLLQRGVERLAPAERDRIVEALTNDPELARGWALKEGLRAVYERRRAEDAAAALDKWIGDAQASGLRPFQRAGTTLKKCRRRCSTTGDTRSPTPSSRASTTASKH